MQKTKFRRLSEDLAAAICDKMVKNANRHKCDIVVSMGTSRVEMIESVADFYKATGKCPDVNYACAVVLYGSYSKILDEFMPIVFVEYLPNEFNRIVEKLRCS